MDGVWRDWMDDRRWIECGGIEWMAEDRWSVEGLDGMTEDGWSVEGLDGMTEDGWSVEKLDG